MRIEAYSNIQSSYNAQKMNRGDKANNTKVSDQLEISGFGKDIQIAKKASLETPDIREELIAPIKAKIQNGTYQVSSNEFAKKLLGNY